MNQQDIKPGDKITFDASSYYGRSHEPEEHTFVDYRNGSLGHKMIITKERPNGVTSVWYKEFQ